MNIRSLAKGLQFCGEATGKRQTYYVFESGAGYVVMSASRTKRASGYFNLVSRNAVARIRKNYAGKQDVTAKALATRSRGAGVRDALQALNILYVLVATGAAKRDDRYQDTRLHFNIAPRAVRKGPPCGGPLIASCGPFRACSASRYCARRS